MDRHLPDAPQDSRYYGGRPTGEVDDVFTERCPKCELLRNPDEADENGLCPNCSPETQSKQTSAQDVKQLVEDVGPEAAGLVFALKRLEQYFK